MLQLPSTDTVRVPLGSGAFAVLRPIDSIAWLRAQAAARAASAVARAEDNPDGAHHARHALIASLVHSNLVALEGIGGVDGAAIVGQPSPEQVDQLLAWFPAYSAFELDYAGPILEAQAEKNGFAPSPGGTSTPRAATDSAEAVKKSEDPATTAASNAPSA